MKINVKILPQNLLDKNWSTNKNPLYHTLLGEVKREKNYELVLTLPIKENYLKCKI